MKTSMTTRHSLAMALMLSAGTLGLGGTAFGDDFDAPGVEVLEPSQNLCQPRGGLCFKSGAPTTEAAASAPASAVGSHAASGLASRFTRVAGENEKGNIDDTVPWTLNINTTLRQPALTGNAQFMVFDLEDPRSVSHRQVTAMWQTKIRAGSQLAARLTLSPDEGFHANHTYRIRVTQIISNKEVILAEGDVRLM